MKTHEASRANEASCLRCCLTQRANLSGCIQLKRTGLYHQNIANATGGKRLSCTRASGSASIYRPSPLHSWSLGSQLCQGFSHFKRGGRGSGRLGIDAYLPEDKATQRLCGAHVAECRATMLWKCPNLADTSHNLVDCLGERSVHNHNLTTPSR